MIIEVLAIETSGLDAEKDIILEIGYARIKDRKVELVVSSPVDPKDHELSDDIVKFHTKTGLLADLIKQRIDIAETEALLGPANLRVVWALDFARPFLKKSPLAAACDAIAGPSVIKLARAFTDQTLSGDVDRARPKVELLCEALLALNPGPHGEPGK